MGVFLLDCLTLFTEALILLPSLFFYSSLLFFGECPTSMGREDIGFFDRFQGRLLK